MVARIFQIKLLDGRPARLLRDYGPDKFIVEIDSRERAVRRNLWHALPFVEHAGAQTPDTSGDSAGTDDRWRGPT